MRRTATVFVSLLVLGGCHDSGAAALRQEQAPDRLRFEIGGDGPRLGEILARAPRPDEEISPVPVPPPEVLSDGPARKWREVRLAPGQTLSQLCAAELGSAGRWKEVATLNGWSEDQVRRLPAKTLVRLPPE
ncbi:MAG: hypothetical protein ACO3UM_13420 [Planctomycetota bacterium]